MKMGKVVSFIMLLLLLSCNSRDDEWGANEIVGIEIPACGGSESVSVDGGGDWSLDCVVETATGNSVVGDVYAFDGAYYNKVDGVGKVPLALYGLGKLTAGNDKWGLEIERRTADKFTFTFLRNFRDYANMLKVVLSDKGRSKTVLLTQQSGGGFTLKDISYSNGCDSVFWDDTLPQTVEYDKVTTMVLFPFSSVKAFTSFSSGDYGAFSWMGDDVAVKVPNGVLADGTPYFMQGDEVVYGAGRVVSDDLGGVSRDVTFIRENSIGRVTYCFSIEYRKIVVPYTIVVSSVASGDQYECHGIFERTVPTGRYEYVEVFD